MTGEYWGEFNVQNVLSFRVPRTDLQLLDYDVTVLCALISSIQGVLPFVMCWNSMGLCLLIWQPPSAEVIFLF